MKIKYKNINVQYNFIDNQKELNTIILPGWLQNENTYKEIFNLISKYTNIYILEFPGFNISEEPKEIVDLDYYVFLLDHFIETLNIKNVILFGHSFGGRVAFKYQAIIKKAVYLILTSPAGLKKFNIKVLYKIYFYKLKKYLLKVFNKSKLKALYQNSGSEDYKHLSNLMKKTFTNIIGENLKKYLKQINVPTILIFGDEDKTVRLKIGKEMNKLIKTSSLIKIDNAGHYPFLDNNYQYSLVIDYIYKYIVEEIL